MGGGGVRRGVVVSTATDHGGGSSSKHLLACVGRHCFHAALFPVLAGAFFTLTAAARVLYWPWNQPAASIMQTTLRV